MHKVKRIVLVLMVLQFTVPINSTVVQRDAHAYCSKLYWGQPIHDIAEMTYQGCDLENTFYRKLGDSRRIAIGEDYVTAEDVIYTFYNGQYCERTVILGYTDGEKVFEWLTRVQGKRPIQSLKLGWRIVWLGSDTIDDLFIGEHKVEWKQRSRALLEKQLNSQGLTLKDIYPYSYDDAKDEG